MEWGIFRAQPKGSYTVNMALNTRIVKKLNLVYLIIMIYYVHTKGGGVESEINEGVKKLKMKLFKKFEEIWY